MQSEFQLEVSTDNLLNLNKEYIGKMVECCKRSVLDGWSDPIQMLVYSKKIQEIGKQLETTIRPIAESKHSVGKSGVSLFGAEISESMIGVKYDFTVCNDSEWDSLNSKITALTEQIKVRETFLKSLTKKIVDPDTGEIIAPPIKKGKLGLNIKLQ